MIQNPDVTTRRIRNEDALADLGLAAATKLRADSLLSAYGLQCVEQRTYWVRYESTIAVVQFVFDGTRSGELAVYLGRMRNGHEEPRPLFSLEEILRWHKRHEASQISGLTVKSKDDIMKWVEILTKLVTRYGDLLLKGDENTYLSLVEFRRRELADFEKKRRH